MAIEAQLFDGTILEFPDDTDPSVIQQTAKRITLERQKPAAPAAAPAGPAEPPVTDAELAAASSPVTFNPRFARQGAQGRAVARPGQSVMAEVPQPLSFEQPAAAPVPSVVRLPDPVRAVEAQLNAMPAAQRQEAIARLRNDPQYGAAVQEVERRYAELEKAPSTMRRAADQRLEARTAQLIEQGLRPEYAEQQAQIDALRNQPSSLQQATRDIVGEQAGEAAAAQAEALKDAGFWERVGAGTASAMRKSGMGVMLAAADSGVFGNKDQASKNLLNAIRVESARGEAVPEGESIFQKSAQGAMTSLAGQAPTMILGVLTGSAAPVLAQAAIQTFGQEYADGRASGLTGQQASARAAPMAAAEVFFERFGMTKALAGLRAHVAANGLESVPAYVAKSIATEIPSELATTATQYGIDILPTVGLKKPSLVGLYNELEETLRQTVLQAGATAGVTTGVVKATQAAKDLAKGGRQPYKRDTSYEGLAQRMIEQAGFLPAQRAAAPVTPPAAPAPQAAAPVEPPAPQEDMGLLADDYLNKIGQQVPGMVQEEQVVAPPVEAAAPEARPEPPAIEQPAPPHTVAGLPIVEAPVDQLKLSEDVPQFKAEANVKGVVEPLGGKFERTGVAPIQLWRRTNGDLEVISGRHRLDLARRSGEQTIPAQIHDEAAGFDKQRAATLDAELNIRDGQGKVKDYVSYFKGANISKEEADARGLLARAIGKRSFAIANEGSEELIAAHRADVVGDEAAYLIAQNAPNDSRLQAVGIKAVQDGKSASNAVNMMQAVKALAGERDTTTDMFGFDDSAMREAEEMAKIAARKQREIAQRLSVMTGASKNPALAKAEGIDIKDPAAVQKRVEELRQAKSAWDSWSTNPNLVAEIRAERGVAAPELTLRGETEEEIRKREEAAPEEQRKAEEKAIADREVDLFGLQPQTQEREEPPTEDLFGGEAELSTEYQIALEKSRKATQEFNKLQQAYRDQEIGDEEFLAGRRRFDAAQAEFDKAHEKEAGRGETPPTREFAPPLEDAKEVISEAPPKGATDQEVADIADVFAEYEGHSLDADGGQVTHVFDAPAKSEIVRTEDKSKIYHKEFGWMTLDQAKEQINKWKEHAEAQGKTGENSDKIVLSLFDLTGQWSQPWEDAGYQVFRFDIQNDPEVGDVQKFSTEFFNDYFGSFEGQDVYAILAACPCTDFAVSGARHFAAKDADGRTRQSIELVQQTLATVEYFKPAVWAIENPVGRIEKLTGLPPWRLAFNPNHFGDPYTKKTLLWGRFNADLPISPVEPSEGSKMHKMYGGKSQATKNARSVTPEGFAYSFFMANNAVDNPILAVANKYDRLDRHVIEDAISAGVSPKEIDEAVEDHYYMDLDDKAAESAVRELIAERKKDDAAEAKFVENKVKGDLEKIAEGFLIGDIVRLGNTPGVVVGVEGDYVRFRPDSAKSPKAYQRVQSKQLTMVARPDQVPDSAASKTPDQEKKFGTEAGHLNADMGGLIQLLGANMYASNLADVAVKELLQNSFDAVKGAVSSLKGPSLYKVGKIDIKIDRDARTISITDNARGMTPEIVREAFFTVAGSNKSDLAPEERSGGLGLAKMGFMLGSERLQLNTVRDGVRVTVDTTSKDIANSKFEIKKSPAPKDEHGTTVTVTIPENYIDPKTGDERMIWFPWASDAVEPLNHPLIGPVEVNLEFNSYGSKSTTQLAAGVNFPVADYQQFKVNFDWGSADIYFGVNRKERPKHQVLSSGVYQFDHRFALNQTEVIPCDIIVNVKPNVEAKHPDYPFENSRERFKGRLDNDVNALQAYLAQLARGNEMADLQESFKGIVSMPRVEAGQELADTAKKLKKVFDQRGATQELTQLPPLPKEVTVTGQQVLDQLGTVLVDTKKQEEKKKEASLQAEKAAPDRSQFMLDMKQDPSLPIYHNNTNVDFLEVGRQYGEPEKFFAELGTLMVEMKEALAKSGIWGYDVLTPENLFFAGVSVDKKYGGVHIKVPYKAVLLNPFYDWGAKSLFGVRQNFLNTMIHEIAHTGSMDHGVAHNSQMIKVEQYLADEGLLDYFRDALLDILSRHESAFTAMREAYGKSTTQNTAKSLEDYGKQPGAASSRGDGGGGPDSLPVVQTGARSARSEDLRGGAEEDTGRKVSEGAGEALDDERLLKKYSRPHTPMIDTAPVKNMLLKSGRLGKQLLKDSVTDPRAAVGLAFNKIDAGITYLRNKNTWYGTGLGGADFARYSGSMRTADALATASVALDNAIRSGSIATEVIFRGGIKFNPKAGVFVAVNRAKGMAGVYKAEAKLKAKLGDQVGTDIIQGYLEAKRSRSIQNEMFDREAEYESLNEMLKEMRAKKSADPKDVAKLKELAALVEEAKEDVSRIKIAFNKIKMSDEEIDDFIAREKAHPELREIMDNWTAVNQNMLRFWRQVGLLSQGRYEVLSAIKDYVPWNRIMDDEEDIHSPVQTTTRSMTNIGKEKLFKAGKPAVITDFKAKAGQKVFKIQPASIVSASINGKSVPSSKIEATPRGDVRLNVPISEGDLVVFQTSREIENMIDNMTRNVMRMTMNGIRQYAAQRIVNEYATRDENDKIMVFPSADRNKGRFNFIANGKKIVVEISDPLVAESVFGMETLNLTMLKPLSMASNFVRRTLTLSGAFQISQLFQDAPTAAWVTGVKNPVALFGGVYKGFVTSLTNTDPVVDILKAAGIGGFKSLARTPEAEIKQRLGVMNKNAYSFVMQALDHIGDASDMAQRVAVYKRVMAETGDEMQALYQAANVLNFNRHGSGALAQAIVKTVAFANAYAQTIEVLFQALSGGGLKGMARAKALQRIAITGGLLASTTLLYCMLVGGDDEYDKLDDQTKLKNYVIPGTKIAMPMHTSAAYFYKAIPESIYNYVTKRGTDTPVDRKRLVDSLQHAAMDMLLGPTPVPTGARPIIELTLDHDFFTGRNITPSRLKNVKAAEQYNSTTSEAGKILSGLTGTDEKRLLNPIEADHLIRGLFGSAGVSVQWASNVLGEASSNRAAMTPKQYPLVGRFMLPTVATGRERLFYDLKEQVDKEYNTMQTQIKREKIQKLQALTPENKKLIGLHDYVSQMDDQLKELNSLIQQIGESESKRFSPEERREKIDQLTAAKQKILTGVERIRSFSQQP